MSDEPGTVEDVASRVADGLPVDWDHALERALSEEDRSAVRQLRCMQSVSRIHAGAEPEAEGSSSTPARGKWGHLILREKLSEGSYGELYRAWDPQLERDVALKLLKPARKADEGTLESSLIREGRLLAKIRHPNVVTVYGADLREGRAGIWMELIRGRSLEQWLEGHGLMSAREAAQIGIDLCRALAAVHELGIVHRDVKAQNAMREEGGRILLMDFGAGVETRPDHVLPGDRISGTPFYMSPELLRGQPATPQSDLYALGVLLYRLVSGCFPVEAGSWDELLRAHECGQVRLLRDARPGLPDGLLLVVERATDPDPGRRYATAGQMERALARVLGAVTDENDTEPRAPKESRSARRGWLLAAGLVLALAAVPVVMRWPKKPAPGATRPTPIPAASQAGRAATGPDHVGAVPYTIEAAVYRVAAGSTQRERVQPGARLAMGDRVTLDFEASRELNVYVVSEDDAGHAYALFPLPGLDEQNPLAPGVAHALPGARAGKSLAWTVDSPGGREHLLVLASAERLTEYEAAMSTLARPGQSAVPLTEAARIHLRGLGSLSEAPVAGQKRTASRLFEMAERLASSSETVSGVWMRRIDLESPRP